MSKLSSVGKVMKVLNKPISKSLASKPKLLGKLGKNLTYRNLMLFAALDIPVGLLVTKLSKVFLKCYDACDKMYSPTVATLTIVPVPYLDVVAIPVAMLRTAKTHKRCLLICKMTKAKKTIEVYNEYKKHHPEQTSKINNLISKEQKKIVVYQTKLKGVPNDKSTV